MEVATVAAVMVAATGVVTKAAVVRVAARVAVVMAEVRVEVVRAAAARVAARVAAVTVVLKETSQRKRQSHERTLQVGRK